MRPAVTMDSDTIRRSAVDQARSGSDRHRLADTRYPHFAHGGADAVGDVSGRYLGVPAASQSGGRLRTAVLIVIAVVALSSIAAIGWLQYQSHERQDPLFQISEPDRSVPALAETAAR